VEAGVGIFLPYCPKVSVMVTLSQNVAYFNDLGGTG
jgi:hypothetical protein